MESNEALTEYIKVRVSSTTKAELERVAAMNPLTNDVSKHVRLAIDEYIERHWVDDVRPQEPVNA